VIDQEGNKLGFMSKKDAVEKAQNAGFDLVIISPNPKQPIAKILDYGKYKYSKKKKDKKAKEKQAVTNNREVRLTPMIGDHDLMVKSKKAREFLLNGDRVKVSLKFRGRELARKELGYAKLEEFFKTLEDIALIQKAPLLSGGRFLDMYLQLDKKKKGENNAETKDKISSDEKS
jgi:translation initiation factor IF-3